MAYTAVRRLWSAVTLVLAPAIEAGWCHPRTPEGPRGVGRPEILTDRAIETMLQLKLTFGLSYSSGVVGLVRDYFDRHHIPRPVPTEATLCRRIQQIGLAVETTRVPRLCVALLLGPPPVQPYGVVIDSTGFSISLYSLPASKKLKYPVLLKMMWSSSSMPTISPAALSWAVMLMSLCDGSTPPLG